MPSDQERRLLALAARQPVSGPPERELREGELRVSVRVANDDGTVTDEVLQQIMMESAREAVGALNPGESVIDERGCVEISLPADSPAARAIREGTVRSISMSSRAGPMPPTDLADLFMNQEAQDAAATLGWSGGMIPRDDGMHIEFDEAPEGATAPNEAVRFQVGRQDPPPTSFSRQTHPGPSEGRVVSRRGADGRFETTIRRQALQPRDPVRRHDPVGNPHSQGHGKAVPAPPPAPVRPPPSRYERISGPDPFGDD